ncbi:MAG: beta-propeller domain-containing protein [Ilumatobacter sp.]
MKRSTHISTRLPALFAATALVVTACASDEPDSTDDPSISTESETDDDTSAPIRSEDDPERRARVALQQFDDCSGFLDYVHTEGAERVGAYGFDNQRYWFEDGRVFMDDVMVMEEEAMEQDAMSMDDSGDESAPASTSASAEAGDVFQSNGQSADSSGGSDTFSTTNVQVEGVDEPDIVKTDGQRILVVSGSRLVYVDIDDEGRAGERRGSVALSDESSGAYVYGQEILVSGDRVFVIANVEGGDYAVAEPFIAESAPVEDLVDGDAETQFVDDPIPTEPFPMPSQPFPGGEFFGPRTVVIEVDVSNPDVLRVENSLTLDGRYLSARSIGDTARVVVTSPPTDLGFLYPSGSSSEERAAEANAELVRETTADDWIPTYTLSGSDGSRAEGALVDCAGIHAPAEFAGFDMLSVVTLPMGESLAAPAATTSIMATGETVYASQDRMYISTNEWITPTFDEQERGIWEESYQTGIHRFALPTDAAAEYEASGSVDGHLLNQFSMHDQDGTFFVATTTGTPWSSNESESQIVAMQPNGDRLERIGQVGNMGKGEQIFSVRYVQDTAYVVTFRQTDPFYVVDLTNPTDMVVQGELKIPGVSTYLHPISDSLVIGVGQEGTDDGRLTGSKVTLFDVSDPTNPREVDVWTLPNSNSDAEFDHRAFLWWAPTSTAVLPLVSWNDQFSGAIVLNITADGISEQGRVTHASDERQEIGVTDCRVFTTDDFPDESFGDLFWFTQESGSIFQACGPDDRGGATGYECEIIPTNEGEQWFWLGEDADGNQRELADLVDLDGVDRLELCWQSGGFDGYNERIIRTMVIGDQLWSLSPQQLQAHDLDELTRTISVTL